MRKGVNINNDTNTDTDTDTDTDTHTDNDTNTNIYKHFRNKRVRIFLDKELINNICDLINKK